MAPDSRCQAANGCKAATCSPPRLGHPPHLTGYTASKRSFKSAMACSTQDSRHCAYARYVLPTFRRNLDTPGNDGASGEVDVAALQADQFPGLWVGAERDLAGRLMRPPLSQSQAGVEFAPSLGATRRSPYATEAARRRRTEQARRHPPGHATGATVVAGGHDVCRTRGGRPSVGQCQRCLTAAPLPPDSHSAD